MHSALNVEWPTAGRDLALLAGAAVAALLIHLVASALVRRVTGDRGGAAAIVSQTAGPVRLLLVLLTLSIAHPSLTLPLPVDEALDRVLHIGYIVSLAWLVIGLIEVSSTLLYQRLPEDAQHDVRARRVRTQVHLLRQIAIGFVVVAALAGVLMTFQSIRHIGTGLFASAGLAGLAVGMAARPALSNLIAGVQIAMTDAVRIGDMVVVEGEKGQVLEVNTTYVVVRLWDLRHLVVPLSYFIERPFQNWTRYSSDLVGAVVIYADYTVPVEELRNEYQQILASSPLWDGKVMAVQVTEAREHTVEVRFLTSAATAQATFELRCQVRERLIAYLQERLPHALPRLRSDVALFEAGRGHTHAG